MARFQAAMQRFEQQQALQQQTMMMQDHNFPTNPTVLSLGYPG
jgi:hypothetical protein